MEGDRGRKEWWKGDREGGGRERVSGQCVEMLNCVPAIRCNSEGGRGREREGGGGGGGGGGGRRKGGDDSHLNIYH